MQSSGSVYIIAEKWKSSRIPTLKSSSSLPPRSSTNEAVRNSGRALADVILFALVDRLAVLSSSFLRRLFSFCLFSFSWLAEKEEARVESRAAAREKNVPRGAQHTRVNEKKKEKERRSCRRKVDERGGILLGKWTAGIADRRERFRFHRQGSLIFLRRGADAVQFNSRTTCRGKVLYLDIHLRHFSSRFPSSVREYIVIHRIFCSLVRKIQIY